MRYFLPLECLKIFLWYTVLSKGAAKLALLSKTQIFSFLYNFFWKFMNFHFYGQHVYQMKAKDILNSYFLWKYNCIRFFLWKLDFQNFSLQFWKEKKIQKKFFWSYILTNPKFTFYSVFIHQKGKLQEGLTLLRSTNSKWQVFETWQGLIQPLPGFLRVKWKLKKIHVNFKSNHVHIETESYSMEEEAFTSISALALIIVYWQKHSIISLEIIRLLLPRQFLHHYWRAELCLFS